MQTTTHNNLQFIHLIKILPKHIIVKLLVIQKKKKKVTHVDYTS